MKPAAFRCPITGQPLALMALSDAEKLVGKQLLPRQDTPFGRSEMVLLRQDSQAAYPVVDRIPILMTPEVLTTEPITHDLRDSRWSEAYEEMQFYNEAADARISESLLAQLRGYHRSAPFPSAEWVDAPYDGAAQLDAYNHLGPATGQRVLQLGGSGVHAVKSLLAGAGEAWLVTPMLQEARFGTELAKQAGVSESFKAVVGIGEQIPFEDGTFDAIYSGGCLHHMTAEFAAPEVERVLVVGGRFAAVEPWQTSLHRMGTRLIGKREANPYCRPINAARLAPLQATFSSLEVVHHGPLLRYLSLAVSKFAKRSLSPRAGLRVTRIDDLLPLPRRLGGSVAVLTTRH